MRAASHLLLALVASSLLLSARVPQAKVLALRSAASDVAVHVDLPSPKVARLLALGHNEVAADLIWMRALIYYGDGMLHDHGMPDVEKLVALINLYDPFFRRPYWWGAHATTYRKKSATQDEFTGSVEILRRGVAAFPKDWELAWLLGLRLSFDVKPADEAAKAKAREEGAMFIERAMRVPGAPDDLPLLAASLRTRLGQKTRALQELREMLLITEDETARAKLEARYAALADEAASNELAGAARALEAEWRTNLPYASPTLYFLLGPPPPPRVDLEALARGQSFDMPISEP